MTVREATEDDIFDVLVLARKFSREAPELYGWDKNKVEETLVQSLTSDNFVLLVSEHEGKQITGFLLGTLSEVVSSKTKVAGELAWFVDEDFRGKKDALKLVEGFEEWGKSVGAEYIVMADIKKVADLSKVYERQGFEHVESSYVRKVV